MRADTDTQITRRQALRDIGAAAAGAGLAGAGIEALLASAAAAAPKAGSLRDIEHVIILMQENRSFDHYFGTLSGVRGFGDKRGKSAFYQKGTNGKTLHPFRLDESCLPDITHEWGDQHKAWNGGKMDRFLSVHEQVNGVAAGVETMGYVTRADVPFYYALADAFTICDGYHCSVIGPTDPNRLMSMSASIDPAGTHGGPLLETLTNTRGTMAGHFTWPTMPEALEAKGVSWKVYTDPAGGALDNVLTYFKAYKTGSKLEAKGLKPSYSGDFLDDLQHNRLPQVSWVLAAALKTEHPDFSTPHDGELVVAQLLQAVFAQPKIWAKTAIFITWDENGGFLDHVAPPVAPRGTAGEWLTVGTLPDVADGIRGPIGLGFRVPMLVVSPFSRGGLVCSDTFDHTSTLRFLETRFGAKVPNLSAWRRRVTGDLTSTFNFAAKPVTKRPSLPKVAVTSPSCVGNGTPVRSTSGPFPKQAPGKRKRPSGIVKR